MSKTSSGGTVGTDPYGTYDGATGAFLSWTTVGNPLPGTGAERLWEDLSVDYETRADTGHVPEPSSILLAGLALAGLILTGKRKT